MLISRVTKTTHSGIQRVCADVEGEPLWFESADADLIPAPEAFASAMLIPATARGETLRLDDALDPLWRGNVRQALPVFHKWWGYPEILPEGGDPGAASPATNGEKATKTALCFTGGVDSFHTLLCSGQQIDYLVYVVGYDMRLDDETRFAAFAAALTDIAVATGTRVIVVRTNLREHTAFAPHSWERTHGGALAAVGHLLRGMAGRLLISASYSYGNDTPWGSHWLTDPCWSSERLEIVHVGAEWQRSEKMGELIAAPLARRFLRVCWENHAPAGNCSRCEKCVRTRLTLLEYGALGDFPVFEDEQSLVAHVAALPPSRHKLKVHARLAAREDISPELRQALNELIERTQRAGQAPASPSPELPTPELPAPEVNEPEIVDRESPEPETPLPEQPMAAPVPAKQRATKEMAGSLIGLIGGFALGLMAYRWPHPALTTAVSVVEPLGELWTNALRMTIIPLIVSQLICGLTARSDARAVGKLGGLSLLVFILLLTLGAIFAGIVAPPLVALYNPDPATLAQMRASAAGLPKPEAAAAAGLSEWIVALVPANPLRAATSEALLQVIVFTVLFALAITRLADEQREALRAFFLALNQTMHVLIGWVIRLMPIGVFALAAPMAAKTGGTPIGALAYFVFLVCALLLAFTVLLYPIAVFGGGVSWRQFARAVAPAQAVAVSTRSSLAALPMLMAGANRWFACPEVVTGFTLPLAASVFKVNRTISALVKLFLLAHLYNLPLDTFQILTFLLTIILLSFSAPGVPGGSTGTSLPAYLILGAPIEALILFETVDAIPDIFKTLLNVTGNMTALVLVSRLAGFSPRAGAESTGALPLFAGDPDDHIGKEIGT